MWSAAVITVTALLPNAALAADARKVELDIYKGEMDTELMCSSCPSQSNLNNRDEDTVSLLHMPSSVLNFGERLPQVQEIDVAQSERAAQNELVGLPTGDAVAMTPRDVAEEAYRRETLEATLKLQENVQKLEMETQALLGQRRAPVMMGLQTQSETQNSNSAGVPVMMGLQTQLETQPSNSAGAPVMGMQKQDAPTYSETDALRSELRVAISQRNAALNQAEQSVAAYRALKDQLLVLNEEREGENEANAEETGTGYRSGKGAHGAAGPQNSGTPNYCNIGHWLLLSILIGISTTT